MRYLLLAAALLSGCSMQALRDWDDSRTHCTPDGRGGYYCDPPMSSYRR
jgi:hypothetical protein